jgi:DNA-binding MarR family transcriptional regulator
MTEFAAALEPFGMSPREHAVLVAAMENERTQTDLARSVGLDKTTMVGTVDELETAGLAERVPAPGDRRARVIKVTAAGEQRVAETSEILRRVQTDVLETLPVEDREVFARCLSELAATRLAERVECTPTVRRRS